MDLTVLIAVFRWLEAELPGSLLEDVRQEGEHRYGFLFDGPGGKRSLVVSLFPGRPWIGRPSPGRRTRQPVVSGFVASLRRGLRGAVVDRVCRADSDRRYTIVFAGQESIEIELAPHAANLVVVDRKGLVVACARRPRSARKRLAAGRPYRSLPPPRLIDPTTAGVEEIDRTLAVAIGEGESSEAALRRRLFGIGLETARLVVLESRETSNTLGRILVERIESLRQGRCRPVVETRGEPGEIAGLGRDAEGRMRLLPWEFGVAAAGAQWIRGEDAAATVGLYHDTLERAAASVARLDGLAAILASEIDRTEEAGRKVLRDIASFENPDRFRHWGEALLAGLSHAKRVGEAVLVSDPYDPDGDDLVIPVDPALPLSRSAERCFVRHRRACRGVVRAQQRADTLARRRTRLSELKDRAEQVRESGEVDFLEREMRAEGIPVGLRPSSRAGRLAAARERPRLEGVRMYTSGDGRQILVGRSGRDNHRLTFKLAGPEDFWFHALGVTGAHVVVRNDDRRPRPEPATMEQAAALAAWFSEARSQTRVEVQWTRRKYVRHPRGRPPGQVLIKKSETISVRPAPPVD